MTFEPGSKEYFRVHPKSGTVTLIEELDREVHFKTCNILNVLRILQWCYIFLFSQAQDEIEVFVSISDGLNKVSIVDLWVLAGVCYECCRDLSDALVWCQVAEKVSVFVMDANDERPQFQSMPSIVDVPEVRNYVSCFCFQLYFITSFRFHKMFLKLPGHQKWFWFECDLYKQACLKTVCVCVHRTLHLGVASTKCRQWTETPAQGDQSLTSSR